MSRRHPETENETIKLHQAESHEEGRLRDKSNEKSTSNKLNSVINRLRKVTNVRTASKYIAEKITQALDTAFGSCTIEIDNKWVKIPRSLFDEQDIESLLQYSSNARIQQEERPRKRNGGRNPIKRLFSKFADSKLVQYFRDTWRAAKVKGDKLYESFITFCSSFFIASNKVFSPDDDPFGYGKVKHYYKVILPEIEREMSEPFTREWLNKNRVFTGMT